MEEKIRMQERKKVRRIEGGGKEAIGWRAVPCNRFREGREEGRG